MTHPMETRHLTICLTLPEVEALRRTISDRVHGLRGMQ